MSEKDWFETALNEEQWAKIKARMDELDRDDPVPPWDGYPIGGPSWGSGPIQEIEVTDILSQYTATMGKPQDGPAAHRADIAFVIIGTIIAVVLAGVCLLANV